MFSSLLPKGAPFFELLLEQGTYLCDMASTLVEFFENDDDKDEVLHKITQLESKADKIRIAVSRHLSLTFITPIDREDIIRINQAQEESVDLLRNVANRLFIAELSTTRFPMRRLAHALEEMVSLTKVMLKGLSEKKDMHCTQAFLALRDECEMLLSMGITELYDVEEYNLEIIVDIVKSSQIYDRMELAVEQVVDLAEVIEEAVLKNV